MCIAVVAALAALIAPAPARAQVSASPFTNAIRYDAMGRVTGTIAPDPDGDGALHHLAVRTSYDGAGRPVRVETGELAGWQSEAVAPADWAGYTIFRTAETAYDAMGRKTRESLREGAAGPVRTMIQHSYDAAGRPECSAVRMNPAVFGSLPASACTAGATGAQGPDQITRNIYDAAGQRLQLREGVGSADEGAEATWAYNLNGQIVAMIDGNGNRAESRYDGHGRQDRWTFPSAARAAAFDDSTPASALATAGAVNASDYEEYGYDANGNRISLRKRDGSTLTYAYDALNRMILKTVPERAGLTAAQTRDVYYRYDLRNLQLSARFDSQAGEGVTNAYDGFGRLASTSIDMGGVTRTLGYAYDANGNRIRITHPDGTYFVTWHDGLSRPFYIQANGLGGLAYNFYTAHGAPAYTGRPGTAAVHGYDDVQRPIARTLLFLGGTGNAAWSYGLNPAGQIGSVSRDNDAYAWTGHYAVNRAYTINGLSQYSAAGSATFGYDPNGNLTSDGGRTYLYDVENRMVSTSAGAALIYDPLGRLFQVSSAASGATTRFLYDGDALVAEYDGTNAMTRRHVHWPGADLPMTTYESAGLDAPRQLFTDHQGSVVAFADAAGANVGVNTYDEYGIPGAGNIGRFQYTGQAWLSELGMYHYKARIYSPTLGRFMQTDPIGYQGGINLYAYVGNDPTNATDPDGMAPSAGGGCGTRIAGGNNCSGMSGAEYAESQGGGQQTPQIYRSPQIYRLSAAAGPLSGQSEPDQRSAAQVNQFAQNPRATFTQTSRGTTLTLSRTGNAVRGSISNGRASLRFTGRFVDVPNRPIIRIDNLRFTGPFGTSISSSPATIMIYTHRDGSIHVATDRPMVVRVWPGVINLVNEPSGDRILNE